ncbi:uncharacterized protein LOC114861828 [Betta splendens]|uniref:Uncharacterized protein LOC114861828 n=1 Tax=Betta splendens TaxID=158456 RepID=A0A9W2XRT3_BETSP|nr:uncharacterized protein LOC114861828 [Betta splendens]
MSLARKERNRRSTSRDRPGTTRKACVSGLSVNRWKNKSSTSSHVSGRQRAPDHVKALDCSLNELISQHKQQRVLGPAISFSTPMRASALNLSSVLADMTPSSNTWSRLKAALSIHRKGMVLLTPRTVAASGCPGREALADLSRDLFAPRPSGPRSPNTCSHSCIETILWYNTIIPVEGSEKVNGEDQKTFGEILHEIIISKELSSLKEKQHNQTHSFIGLNDLHCVQGCYPLDFLDAWDRFNQQKGSENDRPDTSRFQDVSTHSPLHPNP